MGLIDSEEAAKRLARVIFSDIRLYNREKIQTGADLKSEIEEGYNLFRSRVAPPLFPVFKQVMVDSGMRGGRAAAPAQAATAATGAAPAAQPVENRARPAPQPAPPMQQRPAPPVSRPAPPVQRSTPPVSRPTQPVERAAPPSQTALRPTSSGSSTPAPVLPPRRGRIDSDEAARRLARVIVSDIKIYNPGKAIGDSSLASQINDGRNLFRARVSPELAPLFEELLAGSGLVDTRRPAPPPPEPTIEDFDALSPPSPPSPTFDEDLTDRHAAPPPSYDEMTPVPGRRPEEQEPPLEEEFPEAPTLARLPPAVVAARVPPPAAPEPAPAAQEWHREWGELANRILTPIAKIPRPRLVAALAAVAAVVGLIYYFY